MPFFISTFETYSVVTQVTFGWSNLTSLVWGKKKRQKKKEPLQTNLNIFIIFKSRTVHISYRLYLHIYQVVSGSCEHTGKMNWAVGLNCTWSIVWNWWHFCLFKLLKSLIKITLHNLFLLFFISWLGHTWFLLNGKYIIMLNIIHTHVSALYLSGPHCKVGSSNLIVNWINNLIKV